MKICFWAYKGGTGRSLLLSNIGIELANRGFNVGIIDMDCEAPGLHIIFDIDKDNIKNKGHLADILIQKSIVNLNNFVIDLKSNLKTKGNIFFIPTIDDTRFDDLIWDEELFIFMNTLVNNFIKFYQLNYLLIDTRTGYSTLSNFGRLLSDLLIITMRPNRQNLLGVASAIKQFEIDNIKNYFIICSEVPQTSNTKKILMKIEEELQTKIGVSIPYDETLAFEEKLLIIEKPNSSISKAYKKITDMVVKK